MSGNPIQAIRKEIISQAFAPAFGLEEMLIPEDALKRGCDGIPLSAHIDHVVARIRYKAANPFWPQRCRHAGRVASPIETTEDRAFQTESVGKPDDVAAAGGLLPAPHDSVGNEAGWAEPASIWGDDPRSCSRQDRSHFIGLKMLIPVMLVGTRGESAPGELQGRVGHCSKITLSTQPLFRTCVRRDDCTSAQAPFWGAT